MPTAWFPATAFTLAVGLAQAGSHTGDSAITMPPPAQPDVQTTTPPPRTTMQLAPVLSPVEPATPPTDAATPPTEAATPSTQPAAAPSQPWRLKLDPALNSVQPANPPPAQAPSDAPDTDATPAQASPPD